MRTFLALVCFALAAGAQTVPPDVVLERDVAYSTPGGQRLAMDIARPKEGGPHPVILCIHGGGFRAGDRKSWLPLCLRLAQHGYVAATMTYRLAPQSPFPAGLQDSKTAVRWLRANAAKYSIDGARVGVMGDSAGGNLVLMLGVTAGVREFEGTGDNDQSSAVQAVVDYYGPTDLTKSYGKSVDAAEVLPLYLGGDVEHARQAHVRASPLYWVTPDAAPVLAQHGTKDRYVEYAQSLWLQERMKAAGVRFELETLEGADHGFKGEDAKRAEGRMVAFFDEILGR